MNVTIYRAFALLLNWIEALANRVVGWESIWYWRLTDQERREELRR